MSIHWDVNLNIECSNNEEAVKLANYLTDNYEEDSCIQFQTNGFFINADGDVPTSNEDNEVLIGFQTDVREIGSDNVYEFFAELDEIAESAGVSIVNVKLFFLSQEDGGSFTFVKKLSDTAFDKFIKNYMEDYIDEDDEEATKETEANFREVYGSKIWMICCGEDELSEYIENDEEGRSCEWEFEDEIRKWSDKIINEFEFPWNEGCTMWIAALDEDGEYLWDNQ